MRRVFVTQGPGLVGSRTILRLLGGEVQIVGSPMTAAAVPAVVDRTDNRSRARGPFVAGDRDEGAGRLDAVAGSEFVDDRIRLRE
jgi:hypothetical protein